MLPATLPGEAAAGEFSYEVLVPKCRLPEGYHCGSADIHILFPLDRASFLRPLRRTEALVALVPAKRRQFLGEPPEASPTPTHSQEEVVVHQIVQILPKVKKASFEDPAPEEGRCGGDETPVVEEDIAIEMVLIL